MTTATMTVRELSAEERAAMPRGLQVTVGGRRRTIPALNVPRYENTLEAIEADMPGDENAHRRQAAIEAAGRYLCDDEGVAEAVGDELAVAREEYERATAAARMIVLLSVEDGASELSLSQRLGINRLTVRKYRGKKDR
ncbi:hypothetical protein SEA_LEMOND_37 [Mycobacterium phage LeMond]|uniref:Uncharacterized protein n=1 Tax=Mycobacterium phage KiSi TaxID=2507856 RepID=A0A410TBP5_9CAUD|nr:HTH DNA binding protein [Mycobacterium phage KiSi]AYR01102.1 hypothetical protein SEA_LEMOND_37 [Mycobacterium phage LeMond]AYR01204.1 hypothetical protein SEA_OSCAR_37 [Mycobacterium phage Oscar]AYR01637.1 hypothetical protein SEA_SCARLETT_37 [Mycobacterium phage Scarlett]QAU06455.1 hypothetical protein SEA_KISI_37 [Mycobacterium phage KiSi]